jgi:hypothetical protein
MFGSNACRFAFYVEQSRHEGDGGGVLGCDPPENQFSENEEFVSKPKIFDEWTITNNLLQIS